MSGEKIGNTNEQPNGAYNAWADIAKETKPLSWTEAEKEIQEMPWPWDKVHKNVQAKDYGLSPKDFAEYKNDVLERAKKEYDIRGQVETVREDRREIKKMYYEGGLTIPEEEYYKRKAIEERLGWLNEQKNNIECEIDILEQERDKIEWH